MVFSINKLNTNNQGVFYDDSQKNMINLKSCDSLNRVKIKREDYNYNNNITLKKKNYLTKQDTLKKHYLILLIFVKNHLLKLKNL